MLQIAIYSNSIENIELLKSSIQDFLIEKNMMAKVIDFTDTENLLLFPSRFDIYLIDIDSILPTDLSSYCKRIKEIDDYGSIVCFSKDENKASLSTKAKASYFFCIEPLDYNELFEILIEIKKAVKEDSVIIKIPNGERRVRINHLNYINIIKRCLCYHLKDGTMFDGQTLRSSFEKAIDPLQYNKSFLFLPPSLLINLGEIKEVYKDRVVFENDEVLYVPLKQNDTILTAWKHYNILD